MYNYTVEYPYSYNLTFSDVAFVDEARYHVTVLKVEVVVRTKYVSGNDACEHAAVLFVVGSGGARREGRREERGKERGEVGGSIGERERVRGNTIVLRGNQIRLRCETQEVYSIYITASNGDREMM